MGYINNMHIRIMFIKKMLSLLNMSVKFCVWSLVVLLYKQIFG